MANRERSASGPSREPRTSRTRRSYISGTAIAALALLGGLIAWLVIESGEGSESTTDAVALSAAGLRERAGEFGQPIFWAGTRKGQRYELRQAPEGVYVRYLPSGVEAGDPRGLLTIGTYPMRAAYEAMTRNPGGPGTVVRNVRGGGIVVFNRRSPRSVYLAYPGSDYQIEVYDPNPATARRLAISGVVQPVIGKVAPTSGPVAASRQQLRALAAQRPIYWAGSRRNTTYELTQSSDGRTHIRYLPQGVPAGDRRPFLTVSTYPLENAFGVTQRGARDPDAVTINLRGGGVAVYTRGQGTNVHLAFPDTDTQIEVFAPSPTLAPRLVRRNQIVRLG